MEGQNGQLELGPIDVVVIAYPPGAPMTGEAAQMLLDLVDTGVIRIMDALFVTKDEDGTFSGFDASDLTGRDVGDFVVFEGASSGLLGDDDAEKAAEAIEPGSAAVVLMYENRWAAPFVAAVRRNGGVPIAFQRVPVQDLVDALDAVEAAS
jgi:dihydroorotase-like cyclic amidohydrolase